MSSENMQNQSSFDLGSNQKLAEEIKTDAPIQPTATIMSSQFQESGQSA